jgi:hypothetical protein
VALILNLSLPYDIEDDNETTTAVDSQDPSIATFTRRDAGIENVAKDIPEVEELKVGEIEV